MPFGGKLCKVKIRLSRIRDSNPTRASNIPLKSAPLLSCPCLSHWMFAFLQSWLGKKKKRKRISLQPCMTHSVISLELFWISVGGCVLDSSSTKAGTPQTLCASGFWECFFFNDHEAMLWFNADVCQTRYNKHFINIFPTPGSHTCPRRHANVRNTVPSDV